MTDVDLLIKELQDTRYRDASGALLPFDEVVKLLTEKTLIPNPDPAPQVPAPVDVESILSIVPPASIQAADYEALTSFRHAVEQGDRLALKLQLQVWLLKGWIDRTVAKSLQEQLNKTMPDPNWPKEVPAPSRLEQILGKKSIPLDTMRAAYNGA